MNASRRRVVEAPTRKERPRLEAVRVVLEPDLDADVSYLEQEGLEERRRAYKRGEFRIVSMRAEADVVIADISQTLRGPGLDGIESDTDEEDLAEMIAEEWRCLRDVLKAVGISTAELPNEVDRAWIERRT